MWELPHSHRAAIMTKRRPKPVSLDHPHMGNIVINDNAPLSEIKLSRILEDDLLPAQWLEMLNSRVFFFAGRNALDKLRSARANRAKPKDVLEVDALRLAETYGDMIEISPINSGNTNYNAARRGLATLSPLLDTDYLVWRRRRGKVSPDTIKEVAVRGSIPDIARFVINVHRGKTAS